MTANTANDRIENLWLAIGIPLAILFIYYAVAWWGRRATQNTNDLYVAGRSIGPFVNSLAAASTWMSVATFLGVVGLVQQLHIPFIYMWSQFALSVPLIMLLLGGLLWRLGAFTSIAFLRRRYGAPVAYLASAWMLLILLMALLGQFIGIAKVLEILLGLPYLPSLAVSALVITIYITWGGMKGATYNDAIQMVIMAVTFIVPLAAILRALGAEGWWFPPLGYGNLADGVLAQFPTFFDPAKFDPRFYLALLVGLTLGIVGMPHLAQRMLTSDSLRSARRTVPWFCFWVGGMFAATYAMGFAGVQHYANLGQTLPKEAADKTTLLLNLAYNADWVTSFVAAGVMAAGISTIAGLMIGIATIAGHEIVGTLRPELSEKIKLRWGYVAIFATGVASLLIALQPPAFLVISLFWAFCLAACTVTPMLLLGAWSTRVNRWGALAGSLVGGVSYILLSPYAVPSWALGSGLVANLGLAASLVAVPLCVMTTIGVSLVTNQNARLMPAGLQKEGQVLIEQLHGWRNVTGQRYREWGWLVGLVVLSLIILNWGMKPW